ncbi:MAG: helix-hairpin-helix domain-containing protein, partial [Candidatus Saccharimonadales bacterium]
NVVASMVVFRNGVSDRASYRKFKMTKQQNDDYANMYETIWRRTSEKNLTAWGKPDLLLIDGGKGQLDAALRAIEARGVVVPVVSVAKREEEIIVHRTRSHIDMAALDALATAPTPGVSVLRSGDYYVVNLHAGQLNAGSHSGNLRGVTAAHASYSDTVKLFQRIRDESHRFAVSYHTVLKRQKQTASNLEDVPGIGPVTRKKLIKTFGSLRGVRAASADQVVAAIGPAKATIIARYIVDTSPQDTTS